MVLGLLTVSAFALRFYRLDQIPAGLHYDEAFNGLDAYHLLEIPLAQWPVFFTGNFGREPLFIYAMALVHMIWGPSTWTVRAVSAATGALLTPGLVWLGWEIGPGLGVRNRRRFALWCGLAVLGLLWSQIFARYGIRLMLFVLIQVLLWASLWHAWRTGAQEPTGALTSHGSAGTDRPWASILWWMGTGVWAGLSFYTYLPARLLPLVVLPPALLLLWLDPVALRSRRRGIVVGLATTLLVAAPLAIYFVQNPVSFITRTDLVSVLNQGGVQALWDNLRRVLGMFWWQGDVNFRANLPGRPLLDPWMGLLFAIGLAMLIWRIRRPSALFLMTGLGVMLLPTLLANHAPHFQRAIGALPFVVLIVVFGLDRLVGGLAALNPAWGFGLVALGWLALVASAVVTTRVYFVDWGASPERFAAWDEGFTELAAQIAELPASERVYISPRGAEHPTVRYLLLSEPDAPSLLGFDGRVCVRVSPNRPAHYYFLVKEDVRGPSLLQSYLPEYPLEPAILDRWNEPWAMQMVQPFEAQVRFPELVSKPVALDDGIELLGYWLSPAQLVPGELLYARFFWRVTAAPQQNYTVFAHLLGRLQEGADWTQLAGNDALPGDGSCPTADWRPGEVVVDERQFLVPNDVVANSYAVGVGFYLFESGVRLAVPGAADNQILIELPAANP